MRPRNFKVWALSRGAQLTVELLQRFSLTLPILELVAVVTLPILELAAMVNLPILELAAVVTHRQLQMKER